MNTETATFRMRFEFRVSKAFDTSDCELNFSLAGRPAVLSAVPDGPLDQSNSVAVRIGGFESESQARQFGEKLRVATTLAAVKSRQGVDVGDDEIRSQLGEEVRKRVLLETGVYMRNRVHGVDVYPEQVKSAIFVVEATATVRTPPLPFLEEVDRVVSTWKVPPLPGLERAMRLRSEADMANDSLAVMVLAISSVEALIQNPAWTSAQMGVLKRLIEVAHSIREVDEIEIDEIVKSIRNLHRRSISQSIRRLLSDIGLEEIWPRWSKAYGTRSRVLHGDVPPAAARELCSEALSLSRKIILSAAQYCDDKPV